MKTYALVCILTYFVAVSSTQAQSVLEVLQNGSNSGEFEELRAANDLADRQANAMARRTALLSKSLNIVREQNARLRDSVEQLQATQATSIQHHEEALQAVQACFVAIADQKSATGNQDSLQASLEHLQAMLVKRLHEEYAAMGIRFAYRPEEPGLPPMP